MKTLLLILFLAFTLSYVKAQWINQHTSSEMNYTGIDMVNNKTAYAIGSSTGTIISKSTDGGLSWITTTLSASNVIMNDIEFLNTFSGFIVGQSGVIYKTSTSGTNWLLMPTGTTQAFRVVDIINISTIYAAGDNGMVRRTTNGGTPWETMDVPVNTSCTSLDFVTAQTGFAIFSQTMYKTTNEGDTWQPMLNNVHNIEMFNYFTGYAIGNNSSGYVYKTTNTGDNWDLVATGLPPAIEGTAFTTATTGYLYGSSAGSYIAKTTNGGVNWFRQVSSAITGVSDMDILFSDTGMTIGGTIVMMTGNGGGLTSVNLSSSEIPSSYKLSQNFPNPFNPTTRISFNIPNSSFTMLRVFDMLGKEVAMLLNEKLDAGKYEYTFEASSFKSGVYFYQLEAGGYTETKKMLLIK